MSLIPIPFEEFFRDRGKKEQRSSRQTRSNEPASRDAKLIHRITSRLAAFLTNSKSFTLNQIDELIIGLHRAVLSLQRTKKTILEDQERKRSDKKKHS